MGFRAVKLRLAAGWNCAQTANLASTMTRLATLLFALVLLAGCDGWWSWSVTVNTYSTSSSTYPGTTVGLSAVFETDNTSVWIDHDEWAVVSAPGGYALTAHGQSADFTGQVVGSYVVRYRVWYWVDNGNSSYQESFVTITVLAAPPG